MRENGFSLVELLVSTTILLIVLATTMVAMNHALRASQTAAAVTSTNAGLRTGLDLMVRDLLQAGSGLPTGHAIQIPSGSNSSPVKLPGPPGTNFTTTSSDTTMPAVRPGPGLGPTINGVPTDIVTLLMADNTFIDQPVTDVATNNVQLATTVNFTTGPDRVVAGQLMMVEKGAVTALVQVTTVNTGARRLVFNAADSLNLNQPSAAAGSLSALNATAPANDPSVVSITRVRMITYYLDNSNPLRPRLVRRVNNGDWQTFDNTLGTAVANDVENLQLTYDIVDGNANRAGIRFTAADLGGTGACSPDECGYNQIRKVNVLVSSRSSKSLATTGRYFRNTLSSQVSLRGMAFVDQFLAP